MQVSKSLNTVGEWIRQHWRGIIFTILITFLGLITLGLQLNTLVQGQTIYETETITRIERFPNPIDRMIDAPFLVPAYILSVITNNSLLSIRLIAVLYALLATALLFLVLKKWFSTQTAAVGSLLFITSSWVLALSHHAVPWVLLIIGPLILLLSLTSFVNTKKHQVALFYVLVASLAFTAYIPFMFWPIVAVVFLLAFVYKHKLTALKRKDLVLASLLYIVLLLPLFISLTQYPGQLKEIIGIPQQLPNLSTYMYNFVWQFSSLFVYSQSFPYLFIDSLPFLDVFTSAMVFLGIYHFSRYMPRRRKITFFVVLCSFIFIVPLSTPYQPFMTVYIPFLYILAAAGVYEFIQQWYGYFPRNPFARNGAVIVVAILIGMASLYNLQKFYVAWPSTQPTNSVYVVQSNK